MNDLMAAGSKITADPKDKTKTSEALSGVATSLTADAAKIGDPAARQGAQDIAALYGQLAQDAKNGVAPNVKDLQAKVQAATAALGKCSSAEG